MDIRIYRYIKNTKMAGPGNRFCLWVQGCSRHCDGCMATETWSFDGGILMETDKLFKKIAGVSDIEGVTFLGGEPFEQTAALLSLAVKIKSIGLSVTVFTGFTYDELLQRQNYEIKELLKIIDLLIDGPFIQEKFDLSRPWVGSSNQQYRFLTDRYNENCLSNINNQVEVRIDSHGKALINGMGDFNKIKNLLTEEL